MSYQISLPGNRKAAARFVGAVRRRLIAALEKDGTVSQTEIARRLGVHRSVITRQLKGTNDMTLGRVAEIAWAMGLRPEFNLAKPVLKEGSNTPAMIVSLPTLTVVTGTTVSIQQPSAQLSGATPQLEPVE